MNLKQIAPIAYFLLIGCYSAFGQADESQFDIMAENRLAVFSFKALSEELGKYNSKSVAWRFGITDGDWLTGYITIVFPEGPEGKQCLIRASTPKGETKDPFYSPATIREVPTLIDIAKWIKDTEKLSLRHIGSPITDSSSGPKTLFFFEMADGAEHSSSRYVWFDDMTELTVAPRVMAVWTYIHALKYVAADFKSEKFTIPTLPIK